MAVRLNLAIDTLYYLGGVLTRQHLRGQGALLYVTLPTLSGHRSHLSILP